MEQLLAQLTEFRQFLHDNCDFGMDSKQAEENLNYTMVKVKSLCQLAAEVGFDAGAKAAAPVILEQLRKQWGDVLNTQLLIDPRPRERLMTHPFVSSPGAGKCSSCGKLRGDSIHS